MKKSANASVHKDWFPSINPVFFLCVPLRTLRCTLLVLASGRLLS